MKADLCAAPVCELVTREAIKVFRKHLQCLIYSEKLMGNKWLRKCVARQKGFHCV